MERVLALFLRALVEVYGGGDRRRGDLVFRVVG